VATVSLDPQEGVFEVGEDFDVKIKLNTQGVGVSLVQVHLTYTYEGDEPPFEVLDADEDRLNGVQITPAQIEALTFLTPENNNVTTNPAPGTDRKQVVIHLAGTISSTESAYTSEGEVILGTIRMRAKNPIQSQTLAFDPDLTKITAFSTGQDVLLIPSDSTISITGERLSKAPQITSIYPTRGAVGNTVIVEGKNFGAEQKDSQVKFNETPAQSAKSWREDSVTVTVPEGASSGKISITTAGGTGLSSEDFVISDSTESSTSPKIESFSP
jgi:hypothetical protein